MSSIETDRRRAGGILTQWHSGMSDPIYAVGSFYVDGKKYPDREVVQQAIDAANRLIAHGETERDKKDLRFAVGIMRKDIGEKRSSTRPGSDPGPDWSGGFDGQTLDELVSMAAESSEYPNSDEARATDAVVKEAQKYEKALRIALAELVASTPPRNGATAQELYEDNAAYLVYMDLTESGRSFKDGDWKEYYYDDELDIVSEFLKEKLKKYVSYAGTGSLVTALDDAAYETGGGAEQDEEEEEEDDDGDGEELHPNWPKRSTTPDEHAVNELELIVDNTSHLAPGGPSGQGKAIRDNLLKKMKKGTYDSSLAWKAWLHVVNRAAKEESGDPNWTRTFSTASREAAARNIAKRFEDDVADGQYD